MKKTLFFLLLATGMFAVSAQNDSAALYVNRFVNIPAFKINTVPDSAVFTNQQLKKNQPCIIMFFSPDCDHCQMETKELMAYKTELKNIQILMVSAAPYNEIKEFYESYQLASMSNIQVGQDVNYRLGSIYKIRTFPSLYVYDNKGTLAKAFVGNIGIPAILDAVE